MPALLGQTFEVPPELGLLPVHVLDRLTLEPKPQFLNALSGTLYDVEAVTDGGRLGECLPDNARIQSERSIVAVQTFRRCSAGI